MKLKFFGRKNSDCGNVILNVPEKVIGVVPYRKNFKQKRGTHMLQISDMDGAIILTFSNPLTQKEREILKSARKTEAEEKNRVVGAGGIYWGDCAAKKDDYWEKQRVSSQDTNADIGSDLSALCEAMKNAASPEEEKKVLDDMGFEEIFDPFSESVPF